MPYEAIKAQCAIQVELAKPPAKSVKIPYDHEEKDDTEKEIHKCSTTSYMKSLSKQNPNKKERSENFNKPLDEYLSRFQRTPVNTDLVKRKYYKSRPEEGLPQPGA